MYQALAIHAVLLSKWLALFRISQDTGIRTPPNLVQNILQTKASEMVPRQ